MSSIQSFLVVGAIILFFGLIVQRNSFTIQNISRTLQIEAETAATSIGQSAIERMNSLAFDEKTITTEIQIANDLSTTLGKETGESLLLHFDDIDDFNGYAWNGYTEKLDTFQARIKVSYALETAPHNNTTTKTFFKKIEVAITNYYLLQDTVYIQSIRGY